MDLPLAGASRQPIEVHRLRDIEQCVARHGRTHHLAFEHEGRATTAPYVGAMINAAAPRSARALANALRKMPRSCPFAVSKANSGRGMDWTADDLLADAYTFTAGA